MMGTVTSLKMYPATGFEPNSSANVGVAAGPSPVRVRFGSFELDPKSGELASEGGIVVLQWQPLQVLLMLIDHCGEMVTRNEIQERLWGSDVIVDFDQSINQLVRKLRRTLGDSAEAPTYIETIARRGYRLKMPVQVIDKVSANSARAEISGELPGELLSRWKSHAASEPDISDRRSSSRQREMLMATGHSQLPRRTARCRVRAFPEIEDRPDRLTGIVRSLASRPLRHHLSSSDPAEKLHALRQLLALVTQFIDG